ncbi:hypothetical protein [Streptomyces acidiscabies]|uniref:hypothetical protein n=1 Tax=Streptomyces acidiscabies TaxID=42234 RepID=UPI0013C48239|nr:hypothetical protein [Streptomyces acidiscabies]MBP5942604.1 hypothetical protein [Streptomyces sp. LBUM 1476]
MNALRGASLEAMRALWWRSGQLSSFVTASGRPSNDREWMDSVERASMLLEPVWPTGDSAGPFTEAPGTVALTLYTAQSGVAPEYIPVEDLLEMLAGGLEEAVLAGLARRRHALSDGSPLSDYVAYLTEYHPPITHIHGLDLPAAEQSLGGTLMAHSAQWARRVMTVHYAASGRS